MTDSAARLSALLHDAARATNVSSDPISDPNVIVLGAGSPFALNLEAPSTRRSFIARASTLSLAIPGLGAALAACSPDERNVPSDTTRTGGAPAAAGAQAGNLQNSNSRLDSSVVEDEHAHARASADSIAAAQVAFHRYDPMLPPAPASGTVQLNWRARATPIRIQDDTVIAAWTFEGDVPGPIVHVREGDTVEFTLTNDDAVPHSMDFHAAQINPKVAFRSVAKGQSVSFTFKPRFAGAFMYHCGTAPVLMHIGSGMYGAIVVSPRTPLPPAKEFVLVQSEYYLSAATNGVRAFDYQKMLSTQPDFMVFNGRPNQYIKEPIRVKVGDRVRFWVVNCGPTHSSHFHVVGEQFDTMYLGAPPVSPIRGVQTWDVPAGGGMCFELQCDVAGEFPFVNHGFGHAQKGAIGFLIVE